MTERTIEVERTVTDEETLLICDYCGESEEDGGVMEKYTGRGPDLHLHEECIEEGLGNLGPRPTEPEASFSERFYKGFRDGFLLPWRIYSYPARKVAWQFAEDWNQDKPHSEDWVMGWIVNFGLQLVLGLLLFVLWLIVFGSA